MKNRIESIAFIKSINAALNSTFDKDASAARLSRMAAALPQTKLFTANRHGKVTFYKSVNGSQRYISKSSPELYLLARRQYLLLLIDIIDLIGKSDGRSMSAQKKKREKMDSLIATYDAGNLDLARIVMSPKQYKWFSSDFRRKPMRSSADANAITHGSPSTIYLSTEGIPLRSKSERDIINTMHALAVPVHYEEERSIIVQPLVDTLYNSMMENNLLNGNLYYTRGNACYWRVPKGLEWMNAPGSIWKTYNPMTGKLYMYNDFKIVLVTGDELIWEHHGLCTNFTYRCNASERVMILKFTRSVSPSNLIETFEYDSDSPDKIEAIIQREILPRLWF